MFKDKIIKNILILQIIGLILGLIFTVYTINDGFEHLRMSWLVSQGYVPYRDFFEHHHPLLWYVYLPFTILIPHNIMIAFYFSRVFSLAFSVLMLFIICKIIKRYMGGKEVIPYFLVLILTFYPVWWSFTVLKPEILARPLYFLGIYLFFRYAETFKTKYLVWTGLAFTISFLFIQNIVFSIIPLIIPLFYLWDKKNPKVGKDILLSSIAPIIIIGIFVALLYFGGALKSYIQLCWIFNTYMVNLYYGDLSIFLFWLVPMILGISAWVYHVKQRKSSFCMNTIGLLLCCEILQRLCINSVLDHYFLLIFIFISMLCAPVFAKLRKPFALQMCYTALVFMLYANLVCLYMKNNLEYMEQYRLINSNPSENTLANLNFDVLNVWEPKKSYYVMFLETAMLDNFLFDRYPEYDINNYLNENNIKYINIYGDINYRFGAEKKSVFNKDDAFFDRFNLSEETKSKYVPVRNDLWQRKDTLNGDIIEVGK